MKLHRPLAESSSDPSEWALQHALADVLVIAGAIVERSAVAIGLMAAAVAVGGFIGRAHAILHRADEATVESSTIMGGLYGLAIAVGLIVLDAVVD